MGILKVEVKGHRDSGTAGSVEGKRERNNVAQQGQCKEKEWETNWPRGSVKGKVQSNNLAQQGQMKEKKILS
jgi:hypothetical protein